MPGGSAPGRRLYGPLADGSFDAQESPWLESEPGDYAFVILNGERELWLRAPTGDIGRCNSTWTITEHDDRSVTVDPSILISTRRGGETVELFHGYLRAGTWTW